MNGDTLDSLFAEARAHPPALPDALMARVLEDAQRLQPAVPRSGWIGWLRALGGGPGIGGLVMATCVGFWLGVAPPAVMPDLAGELLNIQTETSPETGGDLTAFGWDIEEGSVDG